VRLTDLSCEDWLEHAFGREVRIQQAPWFFDHDCDWWDPEPAMAVAYLTGLFEHPEPALRWYSDSQIAQGLTYLVSTSATGDNGWLYSTGVAIKDRVHCVEAVASLFAQLFAMIAVDRRVLNRRFKSKSVQDADRNLILAALFRPGSDGIVKDDAALEVSALVASLLRK
jgi:hypothetical protein